MLAGLPILLYLKRYICRFCIESSHVKQSLHTEFRTVQALLACKNEKMNLFRIHIKICVDQSAWAARISFVEPRTFSTQGYLNSMEEMMRLSLSMAEISI